jgi:NAD+ diphosphatase
MTSPRAWFVVHPQGLVVRRVGDRVELPTEDDADALGLLAAEVHDLDPVEGFQAAASSFGDRRPAPPFEVGRLRELYPMLGDAKFLMAGRATQLVEWSTTHKFCGRCATPTERVPGERCMRCPACGLLGYPRIAPAVIVLVWRGDEALLAHGARFPAPFYSTLAGFVEIGESLEETIVREVREEVGIDVKAPRYFASQPWPFPHSLMVGFFAEWAGGEIRADGTEILDARWFRRDDLSVLLPPPLSIARRLIDVWLAEGTAGQSS